MTSPTAQTVAAMLMERIAGDASPPRTTVIKGSLVKRQSVSALA